MGRYSNMDTSDMMNPYHHNQNQAYKLRQNTSLMFDHSQDTTNMGHKSQTLDLPRQYQEY